MSGEAVAFFSDDRFVFAEIRERRSARRLRVAAANWSARTHMSTDVPLRGDVAHRRRMIALSLTTAGTSEANG
jgi:hypothetical protein